MLEKTNNTTNVTEEQEEIAKMAMIIEIMRQSDGFNKSLSPLILQ